MTTRKEVTTVPQTTATVLDATEKILVSIQNMAGNASVDFERIRQAAETYEAMRKNAARVAYAAAFTKLQGELPVVLKRGRIEIGKGKPQQYAKIEDVIGALRDPLARHGFAFQFKTEWPEPGKVTVIVELWHGAGHVEKTPITLPYDASGSKNAVQSIGSSTTYGRRYGMFLLLNIATEGEDDDGVAGGKIDPVIGAQQVKAVAKLLKETAADEAKFLEYFHVASVEALRVSQFDAAVGMLEMKKAKKEKAQ